MKRVAPAAAPVVAWGSARDAAMASAQGTVALQPQPQLSLREIQEAEAKSGAASSAAVRAIRSSAAWGFRSTDPDAARGFDTILKQELEEEEAQQQQQQREEKQREDQRQQQRRRRRRKHDPALKKRMEEGTAQLVMFGFEKGDAAAAMGRAGGSFEGALNFLTG